MPRPLRIDTGPLYADRAAAVGLAQGAGPHGVYVWNALERGEGDGLLLAQRGHPVGLAWFGPRGNLVLIAPPDLDAAAVADGVVGVRLPWRVAMGPGAVVDALRSRCPGRALLHRDQIYYRANAAAAARDLVRGDVRPAQPADRDRLAQATLDLNHVDLHLDPARVDRRWLRDSIEERIAGGTTHVVGPVGAPDCKLDFGSSGPGGTVVEGVYTFPAARGQGLAAGLVATCIARAAAQPVCLHVGEHNAPARAAYARAGMAPADRCRILLLG
ncbi:MAG: GNAT family N-acetyltransferase [Planctomycetes bacterium]|nr:GNAT family N-acetyltransferase [Planctomycetota bacterium]